MKILTVYGNRIRNSVTRRQDQFFDFWPFARMKISSIALESCQSRCKIFPNTKQTLYKLPQTFKISPNLVTLIWNLSFGTSQSQLPNRPDRFGPSIRVVMCLEVHAENFKDYKVEVFFSRQRHTDKNVTSKSTLFRRDRQRGRQCHQIGQFVKVLCDKISNKSSPNDRQRFGQCCGTLLLCKN